MTQMTQMTQKRHRDTDDTDDAETQRHRDAETQIYRDRESHFDSSQCGPSQRFEAMKSPTDLWFSYLGKMSGHSVPWTFMRDVIAPELRKLGYHVPPRKDLAEALTIGMEPLPVVESGKQGRHSQKTTMVSFDHFLNLVWMPLIEYHDASAKAAWTKALALHQKALLLEMQGGCGEC